MDDSTLPQIVTSETEITSPEEQARLAFYLKIARAKNTERAYQADWEDFVLWCESKKRISLPTTDVSVALYLGELAERNYKISTIERLMAAISYHDKKHGLNPPTHAYCVREVMQSIRRNHAHLQQVRKVAPAITSVIAKMVQPLTGSLIDARDRALLLIGFPWAFRRSELAGLYFSDITEMEDGLRFLLRRSKTNQEGQGIAKGIPFGSEEKTCPVRAWRAWIAAAGITDGQMCSDLIYGAWVP